MRGILKFFGKLLLIAAILAAVFLVRVRYLNDANLQKIFNKATEEKIVELSDPKEASFKWSYGGASYNIELTLYQSLYDFYRISPKSYEYSGTLPADWEAQYYGMFLKVAKNDTSASEIAGQIRELASKKKLTNDQTVELAVAFVQSIPYDDARARLILSGSGSTNYPYETLYEGKGVCSDKSFLLANVLKEMGYGTALFAYDAEKHMAVGIECPKQYSSYDSGYCYIETTNQGFRIGMIPDINAQSGSAVGLKELDYFNQSQTSQFDEKSLGNVNIVLVSGGNIYSGIVQSYALAKQIDSLRAQLSAEAKNIVSVKKNLDADYADIEKLNSRMKKFKKDGDYEGYNSLVSKYNNLVEDYQRAVKKYNQQVANYNAKVKQYNSLIKSF